MKKILAMTMALAMSLSLVACGGNGTTSSAGSASSQGAASSEAGSASTGSASSSSASGGYGDFASSLVEEGKLIMSTNAQFPPYEMVADGEGFEGTGFEGIDVEIAYAIAQKLGLELIINDMEFDGAMLAVQNNSADVMLAGLSYREDRDQVMDFTDSYATGVQVVIVKEGSDVTMDNLGEKMIGTQRGTTGYIYASDTPENGGYGEDHVSAYDNGATAVQALVNGQVDAVIIDEAPAKEFVAANEGLTILDTEYVTENYAIGVNKDNTALLDAINQALAELTADGTIQSIVDKYITAE